MNDPSENNSLRAQVFRNMREKETEELIAIWQTNDRDAWTDDAFDAIREILMERLGELPEQGFPESEDDSADDDEEFLYPEERKLIWIADSAKYLSWVILAIGLANSIITTTNHFINFVPDFARGSDILDTLIYLGSAISNLLSAGYIFFVLQAIAEIIYLLMDIREIVHPVDIQGNTIT